MLEFQSWHRRMSFDVRIFLHFHWGMPQNGPHFIVVCSNLFPFWCYHRSLDWAIWPNYEVVGFQPRSGIATVLELCRLALQLSLAPPAPPVSAAFWIVLISSSLLPPPISSILRHITSLFVTPAPRLLSRRGSSFTWTSPTPATRQPPPLVSAPRLLLPPYFHLMWFMCLSFKHI